MNNLAASPDFDAAQRKRVLSMPSILKCEITWYLSPIHDHFFPTKAPTIKYYGNPVFKKTDENGFAALMYIQKGGDIQ